MWARGQSGPSRKGTEVTVGDRTGVLPKSLPAVVPGRPAADPTGWQLWVQQPSGIWLIVQFWSWLGMSQDQMVELAAGSHVHKNAIQGV